jgi:hypothetical protein
VFVGAAFTEQKPLGDFSVFDIVFLAGLLCAVRVMVAGVERDRGAGGLVVRSRWAMLAGALTSAGFLGAVLTRLDTVRGLVLAVALVAAAAGALTARVLVRRAVAMPVSDHEFNPRFAMQGVPATVVEAIPPTGAGVVSLPSRAGPPRLVAARSLNGGAIACNVEVAVERIDDGVAFVEAWSAIEARL